MPKKFEDDDEFKFIEPDEWRGEKKEDYDQIILKQIRKCAELFSKDRVEGHFVERTTKRGTTVIYKESENAELIHTVETLYDLLLYNIIKSTDYEKKFEEIEEETKELKKKIKEKYKLENYEGFIPAENPSIKEYSQRHIIISREKFQQLLLLYNKVRIEQEVGTQD